jgi:hypothetical protein
MTKIAIIGNAGDKFTETTKNISKELIRSWLHPGDILISGGCHLGGIDIWAEEIAKDMGIETIIYRPRLLQWNPLREYGFKKRNMDIAENCEVLNVIVVKDYPPGYKGYRYAKCYHCNTKDHVKSGACWTAKRAMLLGKKVTWFMI